jgi:oligopeptide transport system ATP-binding protein
MPSGCAFASRCSRVSDRCQREAPLLRPVGGNRRVACVIEQPADTPQNIGEAAE